MKDFNIITPTKIFFGKGKEKMVGKIIKEYGYKKVLIHYGQNSVIKSGLLDNVKSYLDNENIEYITLGGVLPNPDVSLVKEGINLCKENKIELILALGGGSVIDSSKLISHGVYYNGDPYDISLKKVESKNHLPVGVILTLAAAGSEMSTSCVISSRELEKKKGFNTDLNRPLFAIENPELTYSVSKYQTACGITDIISHTFERYFNSSDKFELADSFAEGLIKTVMEAGIECIKNPTSYNARASLMLASSYSHNGITSLGKDSFMPIHQLEHELSARYPSIAHGAGLAVLTPSWMKCVYKKDENKFIKFAVNVLNLTKDLPTEEIILKSIEKMKEFYHIIGMPSSLSELGVKKEDLKLMSETLTNNGNFVFPSNVPLDYNLALEIYENCY